MDWLHQGPDNQATKDWLFSKEDRIWCCLAQSSQLPSSFLQTSGPGSQIEPATFLSGSVWLNFVWQSGPWCSQGIKKI